MAAKLAGHYHDPYAAYAQMEPDHRAGRGLAPAEGGDAMDGDDEDAELFGLDVDEEMDAKGGDDDGDGIDIQLYHSTKDVLRYQEAEEARKKRARAAKRKPKSARVWRPNGQYELVRGGIPLLDDPDAVGKDLCEANFFYFRHVALDDGRHVEFASDPQRPLWKGVFKVPPDCGCGPDEYWNPTQTNYKIIYGPRINDEGQKEPGRDKANQPEDNMVMLRDGTMLPYWVDEWQRHKDNDQEHKLVSRQKKDAQRKALLPAGPAIRPLQGAMLSFVNGQQFAQGTFNAGAFLKANLANQVATRMSTAAIRAMHRKPPPPPPPPPAAEPFVQPEVLVNVVEERASFPPEMQIAHPPPPPDPAPQNQATAALLQTIDAMRKKAEEEALLHSIQAAAEKKKQEPPPAPVPPAVPTPAPPTVPAPVPLTVTEPVDVVLSNRPLIRKLKNAFLDQHETTPVTDMEEIVILFIDHLQRGLEGKTAPSTLPPLLRKAKYMLLGKEEQDITDVETIVDKFMGCVALKVAEMTAPK